MELVITNVTKLEMMSEFEPGQSERWIFFWLRWQCGGFLSLAEGAPAFWSDFNITSALTWALLQSFRTFNLIFWIIRLIFWFELESWWYTQHRQEIRLLKYQFRAWHLKPLPPALRKPEHMRAARFRLTWATQGVEGWPGLHSELTSKTTNKPTLLLTLAYSPFSATGRLMIIMGAFFSYKPSGHWGDIFPQKFPFYSRSSKVRNKWKTRWQTRVLSLHPRRWPLYPPQATGVSDIRSTQNMLRSIKLFMIW